MNTEPSLDSILSGRASAPADIPAPIADEPEALSRDDVLETPAETDALPGREPEPGEPQPDKVGAAFKAQREDKAKRYTEQVAEFQRQLEERDRRWEERFSQMLAATRQPAPAQPQPQPVETPEDALNAFLADPTKATQRAVQPVLQQFGEQFAAQQRAQEQTLFAMQQAVAETRHGAEKIKEAEAAFLAAANSKALDPADFHRVVNAPNRWDAAVAWHDEQQRRALLADVSPEELQAFIASRNGAGSPSVSGQPAPQPQRPAAPLPSNFADARNAGSRAGPAWSGPPPLKDIFARK